MLALNESLRHVIQEDIILHIQYTVQRCAVCGTSSLRLVTEVKAQCQSLEWEQHCSAQAKVHCLSPSDSANKP